MSGWIGADGDFSVSLDSDTLVWLFSDTFIGKVKDGRRADCVMINNSVGIQRVGSKEPVRFFYSTGADGKPASFVTPSEGPGYFWLFDGVVTGKGLFMFLMRIEHVDNGTGFPFRGIGSSLGHVENPKDSPPKWRMTQRKIPFCRYEADGSLFFGSAVMKDGSYVYIYGLDSLTKTAGGKRAGAMILARAPVDEMGDFDAWRFYFHGKWGKDYTQCDALCSGMSTEYSVCYVPALGKYVAVYTAGGIFGTIVMRFSPKPEGPWGEPITLYDCPDKHWHKSTYSYAAKVHPELSRSPNELIISYATNSTEFSDLFEDARLYWPRFVRVTVDAPGLSHENTEERQ